MSTNIANQCEIQFITFNFGGHERFPLSATTNWWVGCPYTFVRDIQDWKVWRLATGSEWADNQISLILKHGLTVFSFGLL